MTKRIKSLLGNEFVRGGFFVTFSTILVSLVNYFFHFLTGRSLGPVGYGEIIAIYSYYNLIVVPIVVVITVITQKISAHTTNQISFVIGLEDFFWKKLQRWWLLVLLMLIFIPFISRLTNLSLLSSFVFIIMVILAYLCSFYSSAFQGLKLFLIFSAISVVTVLIRLIGPILTTLTIDGVTTILLFIIISNIFQLLISKFLLNHYTSQRNNHFHLSINKRLLNIFFDKQVIITSLSLFAITALNNLDVIYVKKFMPSDTVGLYGVWSLFSRLVYFIVSPIISVAFVFFASSSNKYKQNKVFLLLLIIFILAGILSYLSYSLLSFPLVTLLFGNQFGKIASYLSFSAIFGSLYTAIFFINNYFLAKKSFFSLILSFFIPFYGLFLLFIPKQLFSLMRLNIFFSAAVAACYLLAYLYSIISTNEK